MFMINTIISILAATNFISNIETKTTAKPDFLSNRVHKRESISYFNFKNSLMFELVEDLKQLTCFTCDQSISNDECNRKAIDEPCSLDLNENVQNMTQKSSKKDFACYTVHKFNSVTLETISIEKKCSIDCKPDMIGCTTSVIKTTPNKHHHIKTCTYCCNKNYCNMDAARSMQETLQLSSEFMQLNKANSAFIIENTYYIVFIIIINLFSFYNI